MTLFQNAWIIAGMIIGYYAPQSILATFKIRTPVIMDLSFAFIGALIAYTLVK